MDNLLMHCNEDLAEDGKSTAGAEKQLMSERVKACMTS